MFFTSCSVRQRGFRKRMRLGFVSVFFSLAEVEKCYGYNHKYHKYQKSKTDSLTSWIVLDMIGCHSNPILGFVVVDTPKISWFYRLKTPRKPDWKWTSPTSDCWLCVVIWCYMSSITSHRCKLMTVKCPLNLKKKVAYIIHPKIWVIHRFSWWTSHPQKRQKNSPKPQVIQGAMVSGLASPAALRCGAVSCCTS
jgi:hypothetical protein